MPRRTERGCRRRPGDGAVGGRERGHAVAAEDRHASLRLGGFDGGLERGDDARTGAPRDVEARHRVAGAGGGVAAALGPAHDREEADALLTQPGALLLVRELQVRLRPAPRPGVLLAVEARGAEPVLASELERVLDADAPLLGRVDEEQSAEGPPRLPAQVRPRLLVDDHHPLSGGDGLTGGDETGQTPADHEDVGGEGGGGGGHGDSFVGFGWDSGSGVGARIRRCRRAEVRR